MKADNFKQYNAWIWSNDDCKCFLKKQEEKCVLNASFLSLDWILFLVRVNPSLWKRLNRFGRSGGRMKQTHPCVTFGGSHRRQSNANRCSPIHNHLSKRRGETQMLDSSGARCMQAFRPILCKSACVALLRSHGQENHKYDFFFAGGG